MKMRLANVFSVGTHTFLRVFPFSPDMKTVLGTEVVDLTFVEEGDGHVPLRHGDTIKVHAEKMELCPLGRKWKKKTVQVYRRIFVLGRETGKGSRDATMTIGDIKHAPDWKGEKVLHNAFELMTFGVFYKERFVPVADPRWTLIPIGSKWGFKNLLKTPHLVPSELVSETEPRPNLSNWHRDGRRGYVRGVVEPVERKDGVWVVATMLPQTSQDARFAFGGGVNCFPAVVSDSTPKITLTSNTSLRLERVDVREDYAELKGVSLVRERRGQRLCRFAICDSSGNPILSGDEQVPSDIFQLPLNGKKVKVKLVDRNGELKVPVAGGKEVQTVAFDLGSKLEIDGGLVCFASKERVHEVRADRAAERAAIRQADIRSAEEMVEKRATPEIVAFLDGRPEKAAAARKAAESALSEKSELARNAVEAELVGKSEEERSVAMATLKGKLDADTNAMEAKLKSAIDKERTDFLNRLADAIAAERSAVAKETETQVPVSESPNPEVPTGEAVETQETGTEADAAADAEEAKEEGDPDLTEAERILAEEPTEEHREILSELEEDAVKRRTEAEARLEVLAQSRRDEADRELLDASADRDTVMTALDAQLVADREEMEAQLAEVKAAAREAFVLTVASILADRTDAKTSTADPVANAAGNPVEEVEAEPEELPPLTLGRMESPRQKRSTKC